MNFLPAERWLDALPFSTRIVADEHGKWMTAVLAARRRQRSVSALGAKGIIAGFV